MGCFHAGSLPGDAPGLTPSFRLFFLDPVFPAFGLLDVDARLLKRKRFGYGGMKAYFWWIESVFATATIPVAILLVEMI
jgi:hypothetical protein